MGLPGDYVLPYVADLLCPPSAPQIQLPSEEGSCIATPLPLPCLEDRIEVWERT